MSERVSEWMEWGGVGWGGVGWSEVGWSGSMPERDIRNNIVLDGVFQIS